MLLKLSTQADDEEEVHGGRSVVARAVWTAATAAKVEPIQATRRREVAKMRKHDMFPKLVDECGNWVSRSAGDGGGETGSGVEDDSGEEDEPSHHECAQMMEI